MSIENPGLPCSLRRAMLAVPWAAVVGAAIRPLKAWAADWPKELFAATSSADLTARLGAATPQPGDAILLDVPEIVDGGSQVEVRVASSIALTESIFIAIDRAAQPLVAQFTLSRDLEADVTVTVRLASTATVRALVRAEGKLYAVAKEVKVAENPPVPASKPRKERA